MGNYVLVDDDDKVQGGGIWDGVADWPTPGLTKHLLPDNPPAFRLGDTYHTADDTVTPRPDTTEETLLKNSVTLAQKGADALASNATFLAIPTANVTNAQAVAQLKALTRQMNGIIRQSIRALDDIADT